jgi:hypothetical protein
MKKIDHFVNITSQTFRPYTSQKIVSDVLNYKFYLLGKARKADNLTAICEPVV